MTELARLADLTVIFTATSSPRGGDWKFADIGFPHVVVGGPAIRRQGPLVSDYYFNPRIMAHLVRLNPAAVISAGWSFPTWYAALYARARTRRSALIIQSDGTCLTEARLNPAQLASRRLLTSIADGFAANSGQARQRFIEIGAAPEKVYLAPHSTNLQPLWSIGASRTDPESGPLRVLMVGRLVAHKGFEQALLALADARARGAQMRVTIAGSGPDEHRLRGLVRGLGIPVQFLGFIDQPGLPEVFRQADVLIFPSLRDEFGFVLLEAQAAGLACIASPYAGATADLVVDGENALVVDPYDRRGMATALLSLASDARLLGRLGRNAHLSSLARTPRRAAEGYLAAVQAALR